MDLSFLNQINMDYMMNLFFKAHISVQNRGNSFQNTLFTKGMTSTKASSTEGVSQTDMSFEERWKSRFPGGYYHVMDAYQIPQGTWEREDFPFESFFSEKVDESVLNWTPSGKEPSMTDPKVQARLNSVLGQHSIVVPPELEEKLKTNPALADKIMKNIDELFAWNGYPVPGRVNSALIVLDENGEVARWRLISGGGISGPTPEEQRQFLAEQRAKRQRREEYERWNEEAALKRYYWQQELRKGNSI